MSWFNDTFLREYCVDAICGTTIGIAKGIFGAFSEDEIREVMDLEKLAEATIKKSPEFVTDAAICEGIKQGQYAALDEFAKTATPAMEEAGVILAAKLVCNKSFKARFASLLSGACLNLVGC